jgi:hypothetical protein
MRKISSITGRATCSHRGGYYGLEGIVKLEGIVQFKSIILPRVLLMMYVESYDVSGAVKTGKKKSALVMIINNSTKYELEVSVCMVMHVRESVIPSDTHSCSPWEGGGSACACLLLIRIMLVISSQEVVQGPDLCVIYVLEHDMEPCQLCGSPIKRHSANCGIK